MFPHLMVSFNRKMPIMQPETSLISLGDIYKAKIHLKNVIADTPLLFNSNLSEKYQCNVFLKREDLQIVRSYKLRGAYNKISHLSPEALKKGIVCASAGNHAQGVAFACQKLGVFGTIYMPITTPQQKVEKVKRFGKEQVKVILTGDTFDDAYAVAKAACIKQGQTFVHPFDDEEIIAGQGTVGLEILEAVTAPIDYLFIPIGGGGLAAGVGSYFKQMSPKTKIVGVEPQGAPAMYESLQQGAVVYLDAIEKFVDGAAVKQVGQITFKICQEILEDSCLVPEGKVCSTILQLYNDDAIVVEPAGALSVAALDSYQTQINGKNVVCIISGGNNDIIRMEEIKERAMLYEGLQHYFIVNFPQRAGALRDFLEKVLGPSDDITFFQYNRKNSREKGPALIGIEVQQPTDYQQLIQRMDAHQIQYQSLKEKPMLLSYLV